MISCRVNNPNLRPNVQRDTDIKKAGARIQRRIQNLVDEFHKKKKKGLQKLQYYTPTQI
jgi:hypothetical protein